MGFNSGFKGLTKRLASISKIHANWLLFREAQYTPITVFKILHYSSSKQITASKTDRRITKS